MQTTSRDDSMMSDFFQVDGYRNIAGVTAGIVKGGSGSLFPKNEQFSDVANRGRSRGGFIGKMFQRFTRIYDEIKQDFVLSDARINQLWNAHTSQGGNLQGFKGYVSEKEQSKVQDQIINEENTLPTMDSVDVSDVDFTEKKSGVPPLYIGLGAVALVGITIFIVKKF